jgi:biopolymer transport protein ExbD
VSVAAEGKPNLIPLLDMVLQLLMFFIICVNFVTEQVNADVKLPEAQSAKPMEKNQAADVLFVNLNYNSETGNHEVLILGQGSKSLLETRVLLRSMYEDKKREAGDGQVQTAIIIRASRNAEYSEVFKIMKMCQDIGYRKLRLRATIKNVPT